MKNLTDDELITMAYSEVKKMDTHLWSQIILSILMVLESFLLIFNLIPIIIFVIFWPSLLGLYLFHNKKSKKSEIKLQEILDELTIRNT